MKDRSQILEQIDDYIRHGKSDEARVILTSLKCEGISTIQRRRVAELARRVHLPEISLRLLNPIVRPTGRQSVLATEEDKAEYAAGLVKIGALSEGIKLLHEVDVQKVPRALLFLAFAHFASWNYAESIPFLDRYLQRDLSERDRLLGLGNLAAALIYEREVRARKILFEFHSESVRQKYYLAEGNALMLSIALAVDEKNWKEGKEAAKRAWKLVSDKDSLDSLFLKKWESVIELYEHGNRKWLELVREESIRKRHWETLRNCDFHEAIALEDESLYLKVFFGTPYESVRGRLQKDFSYPPKLPESWEWRLGGSGAKAKKMELLNSDGKALGILKVGSNLQKVLGALCDDFYKPIRVADLFSRLYPEEYFNPATSPARILQLVKRLKSEMAKARLSLRIDVDLGAYSLSSSRPVLLRIPNRSLSEGRYSRSLDALKIVFPAGTSFSMKEAAEKLKIPLRTLHRDLAFARERGIIEQLGKGKAVKYRLVGTLPSRRAA